MNRPDPAAALNGTRTGNICSRCNKGVRTGDPVRAYATHYADNGWELRRLWCEQCGHTSIDRGTDSADEVVIEAVFWNYRLAGVSVLDRSLPEVQPCG